MLNQGLFFELEIGWIVGIVVGGIVILSLLLWLIPIGTWFRAFISGSHIGIFKLIGIKLRRLPMRLIVDCYINAKKAGLKITVDDLETHIMAGGKIKNVVDALISAHAANIKLSIETARAIDLAGRDVLSAVKACVIPKVIEIPAILAIAKDGIELKAKIKVTVRTNISRLVGGAGEETIIARVGEGIVTTVGSAVSHKDVLENPDIISKKVLEKGLDAGTAFEILSIDIADIDVGRNIGAQLQMDQAEADKRIAQAKAEERRAIAVANEQEMKAKTQEMRASVVAAEAEVPKAMAEAFRKGRLGVMDYYNMQNVIADTAMRSSISGDKDKKPE
ncbi:MAG: flotillin-like protein FloA [Firmicutes bacterium]|nr:flotillin-like protein FloA [Bacillota bacterium]